MIFEQNNGVNCVDLGESFQTHSYLQNLASIQQRTSPLKFAAPVVERQTYALLAELNSLVDGEVIPCDSNVKTTFSQASRELTNSSQV